MVVALVLGGQFGQLCFVPLLAMLNSRARVLQARRHAHAACMSLLCLQ